MVSLKLVEKTGYGANMPNFNELAAALRAGSQGQADLAGQQEDFKRGQDLRDSSRAKMDR